MKTARYALIALAVLAALSLSGCTVPTDPTFVGSTDHAANVDTQSTANTPRAQS